MTLVYLLDSDTLNLAFRGQAQVSDRISHTPYQRLYLSSISAEEMLQGALGEINNGRTLPRVGITRPSEGLVRLIENLAKFAILPYTDEAEQYYRSLYAAVKRIGKRDARIAAHALTTDLIVVTCNTAHFQAVPGLRLEDWSA